MSLLKMYLRNLIFCILLPVVAMASVNIEPDSTGFEFKTDSLKKRLDDFNQDDSLRVQTLVNLAYWYNTFEVAQSLTYLAEAEKIAKQINDPFSTARVHFTYGNSYLKTADYQQALFHFLQALHIYEQLKKQDNIARCLYNIGVIHISLNKPLLAEEYFTQALDIKLKNNLLDEIGIAYTGVGYIAEVKKDYPKALYYYNKTLANGVENKNQLIILLAHTDIGNIYLHQNNLKMAKKHLTLGVDLAFKLKNLEQICLSCLYLGDTYVKENNLAKAEYYYNQSLLYAQKAGLRSKEKDSYKALSELYSKLKQFDKAYSRRLEYEALNDSILNYETFKQVNDLQSAFVLERKNNEIKILNKDKEIAETRNLREKLFRNIFIGLSVSVCLIALVLLRNIKLKQKLNQSLKRQNENLKEENIIAKYEVLKNRIDPHFLFNSLNTLSSIIVEDKEKAIEFIEHFATLYRQVLESGDVSLVKLQDELSFIQNYIYLQQVRFGNKLQIHITITTGDAELWYIPTFAIQMVIENAIKHNIISSSKNLLIELFTDNNKLIIRNTLQRKTENVLSTGMGQSNIIERYRLLNSELPLFYEVEKYYIASLPLLTPEHHHDSMYHH